MWYEKSPAVDVGAHYWRECRCIGAAHIVEDTFTGEQTDGPHTTSFPCLFLWAYRPIAQVMDFPSAPTTNKLPKGLGLNCWSPFCLSKHGFMFSDRPLSSKGLPRIIELRLRCIFYMITYSAGSYQWNSFPWFHQFILPFHSFQLLERRNISYCFEREECEHSSAGILKVQSFWQSNYRDSIMPHILHSPQPFNKAKCFNNSSYSKLISKE